MRAVERLEDYYGIINSRKAELGRLGTNNYMFPRATERYIRLRRMYYDEIEQGLVFYLDEEQYYQAYYYVAENAGASDFYIGQKDKPVLLQHIYKEDAKSRLFREAEQSLQKSGFERKSTSRHAVLEQPEKIFKAVQRSMRGFQKLFDREGLVYQCVSERQLDDVMEFCAQIKEIPYYQIPYFTRDELMEEACAGRLCCITDSAGQIAAARHLIVDGQKAYGWVGVQEMYKKRYGMAAVFLYHALQYTQQNNIRMCSWVARENTDSIQYHEHIGSVWTGHLKDEWILESVGNRKC